MNQGSTNYLTVRQTEFYGLGCEEWLALVIKVSFASHLRGHAQYAIRKYCCVLMVKSEEDVALDILEHVIWSGLFNNRRSELALRMTVIGQTSF